MSLFLPLPQKSGLYSAKKRPKEYRSTKKWGKEAALSWELITFVPRKFNNASHKAAQYSPQKTTNTIMKKYVCDPCGYVYDPELGDPDNGIAPGTAFEDLPEDWVCPICGVGKEEFSAE